MKKYEILRGRKPVSVLFSKARSVRSGNIKVLFAPLDFEQSGKRLLPKVLFIVGKRIVPDAVDRNRIKRLMREAYRHEKSVAVTCAGKYAGKESRALCIAFMYIGRTKTLPSQECFRAEVRDLLQRILRASPC